MWGDENRREKNEKCRRLNTTAERRTDMREERKEGGGKDGEVRRIDTVMEK